MLAGQFLTPDWKMWVVTVLLAIISKNMLTQTHIRMKTMCKMNKWQYLPRDLWFLKWKALEASSRPKTGTGKCEGCFRFQPTSILMAKRFLENLAFCRLRTSSEDFGRLWKTSDFFGNLRKLSCRLQKSEHSQNKNLTPISQKKLAGTGLWKNQSHLRGVLKNSQWLPVACSYLSL